jgi:hypothetical protein
MSELLRQRIQALSLREDAPFPSETRDAHEAIRHWRHEQRLKSVPCGNCAGCECGEEDERDPE